MLASEQLVASEMFIRPRLGSDRLLLPRGRRDAVAGLALLGPSRKVAQLASTAFSGLIQLGGTRLAGRSVARLPELIGPALPEVVDAVLKVVGPATGVAIAVPRQADRQRAVVLVLRNGIPRAFIKLNKASEELDRERMALEALSGSASCVRIPRVIGSGSVAGISWIATDAMSSARSEPLAELPNGWRRGREFEELESLLGERADPGWIPLHGDLAPWNLRRSGGETWLLDWEDFAWGPSGADEAYFHATASVACGAAVVGCDPAVARYWQENLSKRTVADGEAEFLKNLSATLDQMTEAG